MKQKKLLITGLAIVGLLYAASPGEGGSNIFTESGKGFTSEGVRGLLTFEDGGNNITFTRREHSFLDVSVNGLPLEEGGQGRSEGGSGLFKSSSPSDEGVKG